jgi:hypothetical protein
MTAMKETVLYLPPKFPWLIFVPFMSDQCAATHWLQITGLDDRIMVVVVVFLSCRRVLEKLIKFFSFNGVQTMF